MLLHSGQATKVGAERALWLRRESRRAFEVFFLGTGCLDIWDSSKGSGGQTLHTKNKYSTIWFSWALGGVCQNKAVRLGARLHCRRGFGGSLAA